MKNIELHKIWEGCKKQDRKSQSLLYQYFSKKMFSVCLRYAHTTLEAEDILQNSFVKIFTKHQLYTGQGSLEGWIKKTIVTTAIDIYRQNKTKCTQPIEQEAFFQLESNIGTDQTSYKDLLHLIQQLPLGYRTIFNLYAIEGYTHKEIAEILDISEGNSKSQLSRARQWLQNKLQLQNA